MPSGFPGTEKGSASFGGVSWGSPSQKKEKGKCATGCHWGCAVLLKIPFLVCAPSACRMRWGWLQKENGGNVSPSTTFVQSLACFLSSWTVCKRIERNTIWWSGARQRPLELVPGTSWRFARISMRKGFMIGVVLHCFFLEESQSGAPGKLLFLSHTHKRCLGGPTPQGGVWPNLSPCDKSRQVSFIDGAGTKPSESKQMF